jgi:ComF family protein
MAHGPVDKKTSRKPSLNLTDLPRRLARLCLEAVFPSACPCCGAALAADTESPWCDGCGREILALTGGEYCALCGRTTGPYERQDGRCGDCRADSSVLTGLVRVGPHKDPLRRMLVGFKFQRAPLDMLLGRLLAAAVQGALWRRQVDALVPIPMHWRRRLARRLDHTRSLAKVCQRQLGLPVVEALKRVRHDPPQVGLSRAQRLVNIRGAFGVVRGARLAGVAVCLIDDVTTTGATLSEAARTLRRGGAEHVYAAVLTKSESTLST